MSQPATSPVDSARTDAGSPGSSTAPTAPTAPTASGPTRPTVLVVQNSAGSGPRRLPEMLAAAGVDSRLVPGEELPPTLDGYAGLVMLGGGFMPDDDERAPWLPLERELCLRALRAELPMLGICLGGQLLALCTGGEVTAKSGETENGSCGVTLLPAATDDLVFGPLAEHGTLRMVQHHQDSITSLPPSAELLATSDACPIQAFRVGARAWGLQFHPEVPTSRVASWDPEPLIAAGFDPVAMVAQAEADAELNTAQSAALLAAFAAVVASHRPASTENSNPDRKAR